MKQSTFALRNIINYKQPIIFTFTNSLCGNQPVRYQFQTPELKTLHPTFKQFNLYQRNNVSQAANHSLLIYLTTETITIVYIISAMHYCNDDYKLLIIKSLPTSSNFNLKKIVTIDSQFNSNKQ